MTEPGGAASQAWTELLGLYRDEAGEVTLPDRLLGLWAREHGAAAAGLYLLKDGFLQQEAAAGPGLPESIEEATFDSEHGPFRSLRFPDGRLVYAPRDGAEDYADAVADPLTVLLASMIRSCRLKRELKDQQFQINFRVVELENLYDVGLAIAATLDLDRLSEEILLRAVSLLDARRGALYILGEGDSREYRLTRTFGGEAARDGGRRRSRSLLVPGRRRGAPGAPPGRDVSPRAAHRRREHAQGPPRRGRQGEPPRRRSLPAVRPAHARPVRQPGRHRARERPPAPRGPGARAPGAREHLAAEIQRQILPKGAPAVPGFELVELDTARLPARSAAVLRPPRPA